MPVQATVHKLAIALIAERQDSADVPAGSQLSMLSLQTTSLVWCFLSRDIDGLVDLHCKGVGQKDLIAASNAHNHSAILVSHAQSVHHPCLPNPAFPHPTAQSPVPDHLAGSKVVDGVMTTAMAAIAELQQCLHIHFLQ